MNELIIEYLKVITFNLASSSNLELANKLDALLNELLLKAKLTDTQPVSLISIPLAVGASTSALQNTTNISLLDILAELRLKADLTETQPVSVSSLPLPSGASNESNQILSNNLLTSIDSKLSEPSDTTEFDAGGRFRISAPITLIDLKHTKDKLPLFFSEVIIGSASSNHVLIDAKVAMAVTSGSDTVVRQTFQRFNYQSGNSQFVEFTFANIAPEANVIKRIGYYSSSIISPFNTLLDGLYFESSGGVVSVNVAKSGTIASIPQSLWNKDKLDGTGRSGITVDWAKSQIAFIDFLWLGFGRVRFGINIGGQNIIVHEHNTANIQENVYITSPNQPIRCEIRSIGGSGTFDQVCSTVRTEGTSLSPSYSTSIDIGTAISNYPNIGTRYVALVARLKNTHLDITAFANTLNILGTSNDDYRWEIVLNPTITGALTFNPITNSAIEFATNIGGTVTATGGKVLSVGYSRQTTSQNINLNMFLNLGSDITGVRDTIALILTPLSAGLTVYSSLTFSEKL